jgi:hypothetical protein
MIGLDAIRNRINLQSQPPSAVNEVVMMRKSAIRDVLRIMHCGTWSRMKLADVDASRH